MRVLNKAQRLGAFLQVDSERGTFSVSLKQSLTGDRSSAFACSLFRGLEDAGAIK